MRTHVELKKIPEFIVLLREYKNKVFAPGWKKFDAERNAVNSIPLANDFIQAAIGALKEFANAREEDKKIVALNKIQKAFKDLEINASPVFLSIDTDYQQLKKLLFSFIKEELAKLGIHTLHDPNTKASPLSEIIANMSPEKADELVTFLSKGKSFNVKDLKYFYDRSADSNEANAFQEFLDNHTITFLGGINSKNFKVIHKETAAVQVLKIENRMTMPRNVEEHLRNELGNVFIPNYAVRQAEGNVKNGHLIKKESRTILVTDLCTGGSVLNHAIKNHKDGKAFKGAANIGFQMSQVYLDIQKANCFFPDSKITNWLVDDADKVRIADTKSFLFTDKGIYLSSVKGNEFTSFISTYGYREGGVFKKETPLDLKENNENSDRKKPIPIDAEKAHAAILGRNLYVYLTDDGKDKPPERAFENKDFKDSIFSSEQGKKFKDLILKLADPDPEKRMTMTEARQKLVKLGGGPEPLVDVIKCLEAVAAGNNDQKMEEYINNKIDDFFSTTDLKKQSEVIDSMAKMAKDLNHGPNKEVVDMINKFQEAGKSLFAVGNTSKAERIATALQTISLEERKNLSELNHTEVAALQQAIASHRHFWKDSPKPNLGGKIDEKTAANSFKNLTFKFKEEKSAADSFKDMKSKFNSMCIEPQASKDNKKPVSQATPNDPLKSTTQSKTNNDSGINFEETRYKPLRGP